jgi:PTH1 family peptidyl-tRNA hydrolase
VGKKQNENEDLADFVLSRFSKEQIPILEKAIIKAADAAREIMSNGVESAMNKFNGA